MTDVCTCQSRHSRHGAAQASAEGHCRVIDAVRLLGVSTRPGARVAVTTTCTERFRVDLQGELA
jgi:hypothetical protein